MKSNRHNELIEIPSKIKIKFCTYIHILLQDWRTTQSCIEQTILLHYG